LNLPNKIQQIKQFRTKAASIFSVTILIVSVAIVSIPLHSTEATVIPDLCETFGVSCPEPSGSSQKFFLALLLQYMNKDAQLNIYRPNMGSEDMTRLRVQDDDVLKSEYIQAAKSLPGPAGVTFKSSNAIVENAKRVKALGFNFIELNLEPGFSPDSDKNNVVGAFKRSAEAAHQQGLEFRATVTRAHTIEYGPKIAPFVDYFNIQTQSLQDNGIKEYSDYVHSVIPKLKNANSNLKVSVLVSTEAGNAPGLSKLETLKQCISSVMDVADGAAVWFGGSHLQTLKSFVEWYNAKYS
jgi:hypothetical protein